MKKLHASKYEAMDQYGLLCKYFDGESTVTEIAKNAAVTERTIWRWIKAHREKGLDGLSRGSREDKGKRRKLAKKTQEIIEGLYLRNPKPTMIWIYEQIEKICEQDKLPAPSYTVVRGVCRDIDDRLKVLAHEGDEAYEQAYEIVIRREAKCPNEMWQSDHKEMKIWSEDEEGNVGKVWITAILDDYSRVVAGYFLGVGAPNSMRIASALRQAILWKDDERWLVCGVPEILYTDRGTDYKSNHIKQVAADLGIKLIKTRRKKPRGKGKIERFFRTTNQRFCIQYRNSRQKPLPLERIREDFHEWLMTDYNSKEHSEIQQTPNLKWNKGKIVPRVPDTQESLDMMLLKVSTPRKMGRDGIRFNRQRYSSELLTESAGVEFSIRYDPRDMSCIWVYGEEGKLFCKATCEELTGEEKETREIIRNRSRIKRELKTKVRNSRNVADTMIRTTQKFEKEVSKGKEKEGDKPIRRLKKHFHERNK